MLIEKLVPYTPGLVQITKPWSKCFARRGVIDSQMEDGKVAVRMANGQTEIFQNEHVIAVAALDAPSPLGLATALEAARIAVVHLGANNATTMGFAHIRLFLQDICSSKLTSSEQKTDAQELLWNLEGLHDRKLFAGDQPQSIFDKLKIRYDEYLKDANDLIEQKITRLKSGDLAHDSIEYAKLSAEALEKINRAEGILEAIKIMIDVYTE